jgi:hypothetical protein
MHVVVQVKQIIFVAVFISFLTTASLVEAKTLTTKERHVLEDRIEMLLAQVAKLQKQLAGLEIKKPAVTAFSYKTKFYNGKYEALYQTNGDDLIPQNGASVRKGDELLWDTFVEIAGEAFIKKKISEFRVYNSPQNGISAFVEEKPDHTWILAFNREGETISDIYQDEPMIDLLIHEFSHIVFFGDPTIESAFKKKFWGGKQSGSDFITDYARNSSTEDIAETFVYFVENDKPTEEGKKYDKVRFLYDYPELVKLRTSLRASDHI